MASKIIHTPRPTERDYKAAPRVQPRCATALPSILAGSGEASRPVPGFADIRPGCAGEAGYPRRSVR